MEKNYFSKIIIFFSILLCSFSAFAQPLADADDDTVSVPTGTIQTVIANVLANDSLYGGPATLNNVVLTPMTSSNPGIQLNADGSVSVSQSSLPMGSYTLTYQICDIASTNTCDTATVTVFIGICTAETPTVTDYVYLACNSFQNVIIQNLPAASTWTLRISKDGVYLADQSGNGTETVIAIESPGLYSFHILNDGNGCMSAEAQMLVATGNCGLQMDYYGNYSDFNANGLMDAGDTINYNFLVYNNGSTPVNNVNVTSPNITITGTPIPTLNPGTSSSGIFTGTHVITQNEITAQAVTTTAIASGFINGQPVNAPRSNTKYLEAVSGIRLSAFIDTNSNGLWEPGEINCPLGKFHYEVNGSGNVIDLWNNGYNLLVENNPANAYNIAFTIDGDYAAFYTIGVGSFNNVTVPLGSGITHYRFPVTALPYDDVAVTISSTVAAPRPGFVYVSTVTYRNMSHQPVPSGTITFTKDGELQVIQTNPANTTPNATGFVYNFTNLQPYQSRAIIIQQQVPTLPTVALGQAIVQSVTLTTPVSEIDMTNNSGSMTETIIGAYDPNDKVEQHGGKILYSSFTAQDYLTYMIRFENTGTADAYNVRVTDILDGKLDETSVRMIDASASYVMERIQNTLSWRFDGINLPPSQASSNVGHGYLIFQVKPKAGYAVGDIIQNTADIIFDFNPAIVTNTFETEFVASLGVDQFESGTLRYYPNPTQNMLNIEVNNGSIDNVSIHDVLGKTVIFKAINSNSAQVDLSGLSNGIYFVKMNTADQQKTFKIIKE